MKLKIEIDDAMRVIVSHPCDACDVMVPTDEYLGCGDDYLCSDCFGDPAYFRKKKKTPDEMYIHDWLIFLDEDHPLEFGPIAIHKDVLDPKCIEAADCSSPNPDDDITRFGPGSLALSCESINDMMFDVNHVHILADEGFIDVSKAHTIFKTQGGAK